MTIIILMYEKETFFLIIIYLLYHLFLVFCIISNMKL